MNNLLKLAAFISDEKTAKEMIDLLVQNGAKFYERYQDNKKAFHKMLILNGKTKLDNYLQEKYITKYLPTF